MSSSGVEVVVVGAGLAGLTAAYELRRRDLLVLEARDRVGGRTLSGTHGDYWYNAGAQFIWDHRALELCRQLGVGVLDAHGAESSLYLRGRLAQGSTPYMMFMRLPLSMRERLDLARVITRLRRLGRRAPRLDSAELDRHSLADLIGPCTAVTRSVLDMVSESGTGLRTDQVSGWIGLGYAIHLFGGDVNSTLKQVVGGTQALSKALAAAVGSDRVALGASVISVENSERGVIVRYRNPGGAETVLESEACVMAAPAGSVLEVVHDLPAAKRTALMRMTPYGRIVSGAWLTAERSSMPWDRLLVTPVVSDMSFEQISNNSFFVQQTWPRRQPGGTLVTLSTGDRAARLWDLGDDEVRELQRGELARMYPTAGSVLADAEARITRWYGFPAFRQGWLRDQATLRQPLGQIRFCGDYTSQPGTPGAIGSGYHVAHAVDERLGARRPDAART